MKRDEFFDAFDEIQCSKDFSERMERMLQSPPPAADDGTEIVGSVSISRNSRIRRAGMLAACIAVVVLGGTAIMALHSRIPSQPEQPPTQETCMTSETDQPSNTEDAYYYPLRTETVPIFTTEESISTTTGAASETETSIQTTAETAVQTETFTVAPVTTDMTEPPTEAPTSAMTTTTVPRTETTSTTHTTTTAAITTTSNTETTTHATDPPTVTPPDIDICYATKLEYDNSPMAVGETRAIHYYHPAYPDTPVGCWELSVPDHITCVVDEANGMIYITALAPGDVSLYVGADGCAFGSYVYLTIE